MLEMEVQQAAFAHASKVRPRRIPQVLDRRLARLTRPLLHPPQLTTPLWVLMATTGAVLLIACANLANLMLVRGSSRVKEIAVRLAMGATRPRIISQLLIESLSLSALGGLTGLAVAFWADRALMKIYLPSDSGGMNISSAARSSHSPLNLAVTVLTGVIFGLVPCSSNHQAQSRRNIEDQPAR